MKVDSGTHDVRALEGPPQPVPGSVGKPSGTDPDLQDAESRRQRVKSGNQSCEFAKPVLVPFQGTLAFPFEIPDDGSVRVGGHHNLLAASPSVLDSRAVRPERERRPW